MNDFMSIDIKCSNHMVIKHAPKNKIKSAKVFFSHVINQSAGAKTPCIRRKRAARPHLQIKRAIFRFGSLFTHLRVYCVQTAIKDAITRIFSLSF